MATLDERIEQFLDGRLGTAEQERARAEAVVAELEVARNLLRSVPPQNATWYDSISDYLETT